MKIESPIIYSVSATSGGTLLEKSITDLGLDITHNRKFNNNGESMPLLSLAELYNGQTNKAVDEGKDCLILCHDDVILEEDPIPKLEKLFDEYDVVGVAGTSSAKISSPALWHLMGGGFHSGNLHGKVQHLVDSDKPASNFGPYPHRVVLIDGVFMAINLKTIGNIRFDEDNPSKFHFYDLNFSMDCVLKNKRVGVGDILITHASPGLSDFTDEWKRGETYFFEKYSEFKNKVIQVN